MSKTTVAIIAVICFGVFLIMVGLRVRSHYQEIPCTDIIRYPNGQLVCEVDMRSEDDNIKIYRENLGK